MGACASNFKILKDAGDAPVAAKDDVAAAEEHETKHQSLDLLSKVAKDGLVEQRKQEENEPESKFREIEIVKSPETVIETQGGDELQKLLKNSNPETKTDVDAKSKPEFQISEAEESQKKVLEKPVEADNTVNVQGSLKVVEAPEIEKSNPTEKMNMVEAETTEVEHGKGNTVDQKPAMDQKPEKENEIEEEYIEELGRLENVLKPEDEKSLAQVETEKVGDDTKKLEISPEAKNKQAIFEFDEIEKLVASNKPVAETRLEKKTAEEL